MVGGERPRLAEWSGLVLAMSGLVYLVRPGMTSPDPVGVSLMLASGVGWGVYSVRGRSSGLPVAATAGNFLRSVPLAVGALLVGLESLHVTPRGVALAAISGGITSGLGYALWYTVLRHLTTTRAAIVQLSVPVIAAAGGIAFLSEPATMRLAVSTVLILGGIGLAIVVRGRTRLAENR
ncbi:MAG: DMT family transporter [Myxococcota bacterium]